MTEPSRRRLAGRAELDAALVQLAEEKRKFHEMQSRVQDTSTTVQSKDRTLSMTFDGRGELEKVTFHGTRFRGLTGPELGKVITETLATGRGQAMEKLGGLMGDDVLPGISFSDMTTGKVGLDQVIGSFLGAALAGVPDRVGEGVRVRLDGEG